MKEIILCKYGEIILKGANKGSFEALLNKNLKYRAARIGNFSITRAQSTFYITPRDEEQDMDAMYEEAARVFGFSAVVRAAVAEKDMDDIIRVARAYLPSKLQNARTFKVDARRSDKRFPLKSPEIAAQIGGVILAAAPHLKVDVNNPDERIRVEIREDAAYIHAGQRRGAGGIPVGCGGRGLLLLSGGIDSPVAGFMMARRGMQVEALYFESYPYTSDRAREKVLTLASILSRWCGRIKVHVISLTHIQEVIRDNCEEDYFTLLLRRYMMALATRTAEKYDCGALLTGESLGQVASQTMEAIAVTEQAAGLPVFRPCIGLDKEEIVERAREIGTFDTSILPYEDCCTVFTPRHPRTKPVLEKVLAQQEKTDFAALCDEAMASLHTYFCTPEGFREFSETAPDKPGAAEASAT